MDTRPRSQLEAAKQKHSALCEYLRQATTNISLHTLPLRVGGTIYSLLSTYSVEPLKNFGLGCHAR